MTCMKYWKKLFFRRTKFFLVFVSLFFSFEFVFTSVAHENSESTANDITGGDFTLNSPDGPLSLHDLRGSVVLLFFGYTSCPNVCPISLATISNVLAEMSPAELEKTRTLFISLDPERDNLELLKKYTNYFHPNIVGLTDEISVLKKVAARYGIKYERSLKPESTLGYVISHSSDIIIVDPGGIVRKTFPHDTDTAPLLKELKLLLRVTTL